MSRLTLLLALLCCLSSAAITWAKRAPPAPVAAVTAGGVEYRAPHEQMGCVEARDAASGDLLWRRQIYVVRYDPQLERDVQDVFIRALALRDGVLVVENERGSQYQLNLESLLVAVVRGRLIEKTP